MPAALWALAAQIIALLAIPHALAQAVSKLVSVSGRPSLTAAAKTMDAAAYATLAIVSALVVRSFYSLQQQAPPDSALGDVHTGFGLGTALSMYGFIYVFALVGLGAVVAGMKVAVHTDNASRLRKALTLMGVLAFACWISVLQTITKATGVAPIPTRPPLVVVCTFGPPLLVVVGVFMLRVWTRRSKGRGGEKPTES
jgi:hypothetical protein